jgi:4-amino-4-deoxy-L-arabinose transferase-like glycosyltransferase
MAATVATRAGGSAGARSWVGRIATQMASPPSVAGLLTATFLALTVWWVSTDSSVPDYDHARHLFIALGDYEAFRGGNQSYWFLHFTQYPPLVHLVGALAGYLNGGLGVEAPTLLENLIFVPLLALGCYGTARIAYGGWAGALAVLFALGTPMAISQFHVFMLDAPEAALVAVSVWLVLASDRFANVKLSALAGVAVGLGFMAKSTFPLFVAGLLIAVLALGGWRNWRGLLVFAVVAAVIAAPWYIHHLGDLRGQTLGATATPTGQGVPGSAPGNITPLRWSDDNIFWYVWNLDTHQLRAPLALFFLVGFGLAAVRLARTRSNGNHAVELLAGAVGSYVGMTFITTFHDPRYTLPALVYFAVLGGGWITQVPRRIALPAGATLAAIAVMNTAAVTFGAGSPVRVKLPFGPPNALGDRALTFYSPNGYVVGGPVRGPVPGLMRAVRDAGYHALQVDLGGGQLYFNQVGLEMLGREAGLRISYTNVAPLKHGQEYLSRRVRQPGDPQPCARLSGYGDRSVLYLARRPLTGAPSRWRLWCPLRPSARR